MQGQDVGLHPFVQIGIPAGIQVNRAHADQGIATELVVVEQTVEGALLAGDLQDDGSLLCKA